MNYIDNDCKYLFTQLGNWYCNIKRCEIPDDIDKTQCNDFVQATTCINCKHSIRRIYETGTIDDIEYRCPFQNRKLIYDDVNAYYKHFTDVPECNIDKFESI